MRRAPARSLLAAAAAVGSVLLTALVTVPVPAAHAIEPDPGSLLIGTFNIRSAVSVAQFKSAIDEFKPYVEVAGLQEIGANDKNKYLQADRDWGYYRPPALQQNPVIWRRDLFDFVSAKGVKIADGRDLGHENGPRVKGDSWATQVRLLDRTSGEQITVINVHLLHGAVKAGHKWPGRPRHYRLYTDQVRGLKEAVQAERADATGSADDRIYVLGDFNVGYVADAKWHRKKLPFRKFKKLGMQSMWQDSRYVRKSFGTHNDALIDQIWNTQQPTSTKILRKIKESDHRPAYATYEMPPPPAGYAPEEGTIGFVAASPTSDERRRNQTPPTLAFELTRDSDLDHGYAQIALSGRAVEGTDYVLDDSQLWDNDSDTRQVLVRILKDGQTEPDENVTLTLVDPVNTRIVDQTQVAGTIVANST